MNKQELIKELTSIKGFTHELTTDEYLLGRDAAYSKSIDRIDLLDEPELLVIPQFVADWIELAKEVGLTLVGVMDFDTITVYETYPKVEFQKLREYMAYGDTQKIVARAWLDDDYTVGKEKLYRVKVGEKLYFIGYEETVAKFVIDDAPGSLKEAYIYNDFKHATNCANEVGGKAEEVPNV